MSSDATREHDTDSHDCWCGPDLYWLCPDCGGSAEGCWRCGDPHPGLLLVPRDSPLLADDITLVIVHQACASSDP